MERQANGRIRTTEWEDIQYKHGNKVGKYQTHELELLAQKLADANPNIQLQAYDANEERVRDKLERGGYDAENPQSLDDVQSDEDDDALAAFRRKRMMELKQQQATHVFGVVRHINGADYVAEITEGSANCWVVGAMIETGHEDCEALLQILRQVASRHRDVKFVSLLAKEAVAKLPAKMLPCVVFYYKGTLMKQLTELTAWKQGKELSIESVERCLGRAGVLQLDEEDNDKDELEERFAWKSGDAIRRK